MPVILAFGRQGQKDQKFTVLSEFKDSKGHKTQSLKEIKKRKIMKIVTKRF